MPKQYFLKDKQFYFSLLAATGFLLLCSVIIETNKTVSQSYSIIFLLQFLLLFPILEEWLFRGWLQEFLLQKPALAKKYRGISLANVLTSLLFSLLHLVFKTSILSLGVFIASLIFGYFYQRYRLVHPIIILHIAFNLLLLIIIGV